MTMPEMLSGLENRLTSELAQEAYQWSLCLNALSRWEDDNLLDNPTPQLLAEDKKTIERLLRFGRLISLATSHPEFPDRDTSEMVQATQQVLQDMLAMRHGPVKSKEESDRILAQAFPDEP